MPFLFLTSEDLENKSAKESVHNPKRKGGRPETEAGIIQLIIRLATENLGWGYKRIHGELKKLGVKIGLTTIRDIMKRNSLHPVPDKAFKNPDSTWSKFISSHIETLVAIDFFTKPVYTLMGKIDAYVLVFIHLGSRRVFMSPATFHPDKNGYFSRLEMGRCGWMISELKQAT